MTPDARSLRRTDRFVDRHLGPRVHERATMLELLGLSSMEELVAESVPASIRLGRELDLEPGLSETVLLQRLREIGARNRPFRSYLGMGYHDTVTPPVILRNIFENPGWYTQYTPYQAEIAQGRLEALLNFQTMVIDLTGLEIAGASLLDEGTAAAEAMALLLDEAKGDRNTFFVDEGCHPQTVAVVRTRALPLGVEVVVGEATEASVADPSVFGALLAYPSTDGRVADLRPVIAAAKSAGAGVVVVADLLALTHLTPPGELGPTSPWGTASGSGSPWASEVPTPPSWRPGTPTSGACRAASSGSRWTLTGTGPFAWRSRPGSSTSAGRRRRRTSARPRFSSPSWPPCTPCTTARRASGRSPAGSMI
jgi:glycine dehydrogenase